MCEFARKLSDEIVNRESIKQQLGDDGSFIIGAWSGIVSSILYTAYKNKIISEYDDSVRLYDTLPPFKW